MGELALNVLHFARLLRRAGLPVGPADMLAATDAATRVDLGNRQQVRTALRATMIHRHEHEDLFNQAFAQFWRDPDLVRAAAAIELLAAGRAPPPEKAPPGTRRLAEALARPRERPEPLERTQQEVDMVLTVSDRERLQT